MYTALKGTVSGKEFTLTEAQVNTYLNDEIVEKSNDIKNLRIYFNNGITEIYSKISYMEHDVVLYAKADISLDTTNNAFNIRLYDARIGKLPVNDFILKSIISANIQQTENVSVKDGIITSKVYALGGVTYDKLQELEHTGFGGALLLGDAWR